MIAKSNISLEKSFVCTSFPLLGINFIKFTYYKKKMSHPFQYHFVIVHYNTKGTY